MFKLTMVVMIAFVGGKWCYDFSDPDFNRILMHDLLEYDTFAEEEQLSELLNQDRNKRSVDDSNKCKRYKHNRCCNDDFKEVQETQEFKKECFSEFRRAKKEQKNETDGELDIFNCEKVEKAKSKAICSSECVAKKQGWLDENNQLVAQQVKDYYRNKVFTPDAWQLKVIDEIVDTCIAEAALKIAKKNERNNSDGSDQICNPNPSKFSHCLWRQLILQCPSDLQDSSSQCQRIREKATFKNEKFNSRNAFPTAKPVAA